MFLLGLGSRRQWRFESQSRTLVDNLGVLSGQRCDEAPHDDTITGYLERVAPAALASVPAWVVRRLIRGKVLDRWRLYGHFLVVIDATGHLCFRKRHCPRCLTQTGPDGRTLYFHHVLEAKLVTAGGMVFSLATEFIENSDPKADRQDCERRAFPRLAARLKAAFPQLPLVLLGDGLYACGPVLDLCRENRWHYIFTLKENGLPSLWDEFVTLQRLTPQNHTTRRDGKVFQVFRWVNSLKHQDHTVSALDCHETLPGGRTRHFAWITDFGVGRRSAITLANQGGRLRWKIENQGFDVQKHHGYEMEHAYATQEWAVQNFYFLLQVAHSLHQLMVRGSLLRDFEGSVGSLKNFYRRLAESLRHSVIPTEILDPAIPLPIQIRFDTS